MPASSTRGALARRLLKLGAVLAALALLWTLAVGWALPKLLKPRLEAAASGALGAPLTLEGLELAPWSLRARVLGLRLGPAEAPWLRIAEVEADVSSESVWRLAPVLESLSVREPQVELERFEPGRFNVTPMLDALAGRPPAPADAEPARFALANIRLDGGRLRFVDRVADAEHRVEALQLGVPFVSNLPSRVAVHVEPLLDAQVNGSRLQLQGRTLPFTDGQQSSVDIDWQGLDVAAWIEALAPLLPQPLPVAVRQGRLDLALKVDFERRADPQPPLLRVGGGATLSDLALDAPAQGAKLAWAQLAVEGLDLRPLERQAVVGALRLQSPAGEVDLSTLLAPRADATAARAGASAPVAVSAPASAPAAGQTVWQWRIDRVEVADGSLLLREPAWPEGQRLAPLALQLDGLDGRAEAAPANWSFSFADALGATLQAGGTLAPASRSATAKVELQGLQPAPWLQPWAVRLPARLLEGRLALQAEAEAAPSGWSLRGGALQLTGLQLQPAAAPVKGPAADRLALEKLELAGLQMRGAAGAPPVAEASSLRLEGLDLKAQRDEDGRLAWLPVAAEDSPPVAASPDDPAPAPRWQLAELRCSGCAVAITDRGVAPAQTFGLTRAELALRSLSDDLAKPIGIELAAQAIGGGRLRVAGSAQPQPLALRGKVDIDALDLRALQPYLDPHVNVVLASAKASAAGELRVDGSATVPVAALRWRGRLALNELRALDKGNQAEFVRFKGLALTGADLGWKPEGLEADLGTIALDDFYGRVIVNADGRLNLLDIARREGDAADRSLTTPSAAPAAAAPNAASPSAPAPAASAPAAGTAPAAPLPLRWQAIQLAGGTVDFTDNFIRPNYSAKLTDIAGEVSALAWNDPQPATVKVSGKVDGSAPLEIAGTMHPLGARLATDITASARGVDITRLTAYSARYAGYGIEKGTLSVKVRYTIENGKLEAQNNLYLDQLTFGDKVDSPDALKLPVLLAVSLLKDRNGVIDIDLPISGSLDDPQFSIGGIVVRVIVNLITKAITAPFTLLASAFGGGGQELGFVEFAPGLDELGDASRQRLDTLAKALADRPGLKLEATGRADAAVDEAELRRRHLDRQMRVAKARSRGELAESVKIEAAERTRWLEAAYKASDLTTKPRNALGFAKSLPPEEMEALLLAGAPVGEPQLRELADRRGDRVKAYLTATIDPGRVLLTSSKLGREGLDAAAATTTRVDFAIK